MIPIRRILLRDGLAMLATGLLLVVGLWWWSLRRALDDQGAARAQASLLHLDRELRTRLEMAEHLGSSLASLWERGVMRPGHDEASASLLLSLLQQERLIPVVILLNEEGHGVLADRRSGHWTVFLLHRMGQRTQLRAYEQDPQGRLASLGETTWVEVDYRQRPWYQQAAESGRAYWTKAYRFQRLQAMGVSYAVPVHGSGNRLLGVVDVDFLLDDLGHLLWAAQPTPGSQTALTDAEGRVLVLPWKGGFQTQEQRERAFLRPLDSGFLPALHAGWQNGASRRVRVKGETYFADRQVVEDPAGVHWVLHLAIPSSDLLASSHRRALWGLGLTLLLLGLLAWRVSVVSRRLSAPLVRLAEASAPLLRGDPMELPKTRVAEIHHLGTALGEAARSLRGKRVLEDQLKRSQRIELMGTMAGGIAHDVNNQLSAILGQIELAQMQSPDEAPHRRALERAEQATRQAGEITQTLLGLARPQKANVRPTDLNGLVTHVAELLRHSRGKGVQLELRLQEPLPLVLADKVQLEQAVMNLGLNAADAMPEGGRLTLSTALESGQVRLQVRDTGAGMSPEVQDQLFTAFFTTKLEGKGTGLGLAMVHGIVKAHGGRIEVESREGLGSTFSVWLPRAEGFSAPLNGS